MTIAVTWKQFQFDIAISLYTTSPASPAPLKKKTSVRYPLGTQPSQENLQLSDVLMSERLVTLSIRGANWGPLKPIRPSQCHGIGGFNGPFTERRQPLGHPMWVFFYSLACRARLHIFVREYLNGKVVWLKLGMEQRRFFWWIEWYWNSSRKVIGQNCFEFSIDIFSIYFREKH